MIALITGAGNGIGLATARELRARGAALVLVDRDEDAAHAAAAELGPDVVAIAADVTDRPAMESAIGSAVAAFGRLDLVVANAGVTPRPATLRVADPVEFAHVVDVNLLGVLHTVQPAIEHLLARRGHIVVVASCAAYCPPVGGSSYMVSKAAVEVLARALRLELAPHGISVTTAAFGFVDTDLARATLDDHPVGEQLAAMLPPFLRRRLSGAEAARVLVSAIERRAVSVTAPAAWAPLGMLRGVAIPIIDALLVRSRHLARVVDLLERPRPAAARCLTARTPATRQG